MTRLEYYCSNANPSPQLLSITVKNNNGDTLASGSVTCYGNSFAAIDFSGSGIPVIKDGKMMKM